MKNEMFEFVLRTKLTRVQAKDVIKSTKGRLSGVHHDDIKIVYDAIQEALHNHTPKPRIPIVDTEAMISADMLKRYVIDKYPYYSGQIDVYRWANDIRLLHKEMLVSYELINVIIKYLFEVYEPDSDFDWREQIRSGKALRKHWIRLFELAKKRCDSTKLEVI